VYSKNPYKWQSTLLRAGHNEFDMRLSSRTCARIRVAPCRTQCERPLIIFIHRKVKPVANKNRKENSTNCTLNSNNIINHNIIVTLYASLFIM